MDFIENSVLYIIGCGGHGRSVVDVVFYNNPQQKVIFVDENAQPGEVIMGCQVWSQLPSSAENVFVALGDNDKRKKLSGLYNLVNIISKNAYIGNGVRIGKGCFVAHGAHLGPCARIGEGCIINTHAVIEHEGIIGDYTHIAPNVSISGRAKVGGNCFLGVGSSIKDNISIGDNIIVGAGGVVINDLSDAGVYVGCPVTKIK